MCDICDKYEVCPKFYDTNSCETHSGAVDSFTFNFDETVKKRLGLYSRSRTSLSLPLSRGAQLPNAWFQLSTKFGRCNSFQLFAANNTGQSGITIAELFLLEWAENSEKMLCYKCTYHCKNCECESIHWHQWHWWERKKTWLSNDLFLSQRFFLQLKLFQ